MLNKNPIDKSHWLNNEDLTSEELRDLLMRIHERLVDMEEKNCWDASINEMGFQCFLNQSLDYMLDEIEKDIGYDIEKYQWYPKINQLWHYADYIADVHCTVDEASQDFKGKTKIYEMVEEWWKWWI